VETYERATRVRAPLADVLEFHSSADGLVALTPSWVELRIEAVTGPDGEPDPEILEPGSAVTSSMSPLGVLPRQRWVSEIVDRTTGDEVAGFTDVMVDGPFPEWTHHHRFVDDGDGTIVYDRVEYELPGGPLGDALAPLGFLGFEPMFRFRHRRTRELLETDS
jgi:ligand-binding SRPBCC domain-containing protein